MRTSRIVFPLVLILSVAVVGGFLAAVMANMVDLKAAAPISTAAPPSSAGTLSGAVIYDPPKPEEAPVQNREAVMRGYDILTRTPQVVPANVGNKLTCSTCHFDGGRNNFAISLVGVAASYPKFRTRTNYSTHLVSRVNECFQRSMNGKPLDPEGKDMQAVMAYLQWLSRGLPIYGDFPWMGIKRITGEAKGDSTRGKQVWAEKCATCHGANGQGTLIAPPMWGPESYNDGAGMHRTDNYSGFVLATMPKGTPDLVVQQALDLAAFVHAQPRPHFTAVKHD